MKLSYSNELLRLRMKRLRISVTWIQPGVSEKEIQWEILRFMVERGADGLAFETIVASGPNGSMPHAHASQRRIQRGELITIDMGARYKGYCADMTRTICLGEPTEPKYA